MMDEKNTLMNKKVLLLMILLVAAISVVAAFYFNSRTRLIQKDVEVKTVYMAYACGECYPQYSVIQVQPASLKKELHQQDIDIEFKDKKQADMFEEKVGLCARCFVYDFKGDLYYSGKKDCYVIKLSEYHLKLTDKECCER